MTLYQAIWSVFCHIMPLSLFYRWGHKVKWSGQDHTTIGCCSVTKLYLTLCNPMDCSTPGCPVLHCLLKFAQIHVPWIGDAIQPSHPLSPPSPAFYLSQHQSLFQWVGSYDQVAKVLELQLQHQSFQWIFRTDWFDLPVAQGTANSLLQHHSSKASILGCSAFFMVQLSHPYMTTGKTIALTIQTFASKVMSLLLNMLSRLVITFLPRSKCLLISWLQSPSTMILEPRKWNLSLFPLFPHLFVMKW